MPLAAAEGRRTGWLQVLDLSPPRAASDNLIRWRSACGELYARTPGEEQETPTRTPTRNPKSQTSRALFELSHFLHDAAQARFRRGTGPTPICCQGCREPAEAGPRARRHTRLHSSCGPCRGHTRGRGRARVRNLLDRPCCDGWQCSDRLSPRTGCTLAPSRGPTMGTFRPTTTPPSAEGTRCTSRSARPATV